MGIVRCRPLQLVLATAVLLGGCTTPPPSLRPAAGVALPQTWARGLPGAVGPTMPAPQEWWQAFGDAWLLRLVEGADAANTDIGTAQANLRRARALRDSAAAALRPTLSASASAQRADTAAGSPQNLFRAGFDAGWEPDLFGRAGHALAAAEADARSAARLLAATKVSIAGEVGAAYVQWRGTLMRLAVTRRNLQTQAETLQITRWRAQAGLVTLLEVEQARSAVEQTRALLPLIETSAAQTRHALTVLTGAPPGALDSWLDPAAADTTALPAPPARLALDIPARVLRQRPDVRAREDQLAAAAERVAAADANRYPTVQLSASLAWSALTLGAVGSTAPAAALLAGVAQPVFDGGARRAQRDTQSATFEAAQQAYRAQVLLALREVEDALVQLEGSRQRLASLSEAAQAAEIAALLARRRYESGIVDFQTVLDTQRSQLTVQESLVGAQADWLTSHIVLYKVLGGGWRAGDADGENPG